MEFHAKCQSFERTTRQRLQIRGENQQRIEQYHLSLGNEIQTPKKTVFVKLFKFQTDQGVLKTLKGIFEGKNITFCNTYIFDKADLELCPIAVVVDLFEEHAFRTLLAPHCVHVNLDLLQQFRTSLTQFRVGQSLTVHPGHGRSVNTCGKNLYLYGTID